MSLAPGQGQALTQGQVLQHRYRIVAPLGQGGMGAVYRAWHLGLKMPVAIKEMVPQPGLDAAQLDKLRKQFEQEAAVLARLRHPHLVLVTDYFIESGRTYLVMDFVKGESLAARIQRDGPLTEADALRIADHLLDALAYCHSRNVLHRDIKPHNIIVQPDGTAVLVDFGLVKLWDPADPRTKTAIRGSGTPEYAPLEQFGGRDTHTGPHSDIYSLGATLYHALIGEAPPTVTERMLDPTMLKRPTEVCQDVSARTEAAILKAMALQPGDRFATADAMRCALLPDAGARQQGAGAQDKTRGAAHKTPDPVPHVAPTTPAPSSAAPRTADPAPGAAKQAPGPLPGAPPVAPASSGSGPTGLGSAPTGSGSVPTKSGSGELKFTPNAAPPKKSGMHWGCWVGIAVGSVLLICTVLVVIYSILQSLSYSSYTAPVQTGATATAQARARTTATAAARQAATATVQAQSRATATAEARDALNATATAEIRATATTAARVMPTATAAAANAVRVWRPTNGSLAHDSEDNLIEEYFADVSLADFIVEATFYNPYGRDVGNCDYGFLVRYTGSSFHAIRVTPDGVVHNLVIDGEWTFMHGGKIAFNDGAGEANTVRVIATGDSGQVWVNGAYITTLDLSGLTGPGSIRAATGLMKDYEVTGYTTDFEAFTIWSLD